MSLNELECTNRLQNGKICTIFLKLYQCQSRAIMALVPIYHKCKKRRFVISLCLFYALSSSKIGENKFDRVCTAGYEYAP